MRYTNKELLKLHIAQLQLELAVIERQSLMFKAVNRRIDLLSDIVSSFIESRQGEWSDSHDETKTILSVLAKFKTAEIIGKEDSLSQHHQEQAEAMIAEMIERIKGMPDDEG